MDIKCGKCGWMWSSDVKVCGNCGQSLVSLENNSDVRNVQFGVTGQFVPNNQYAGNAQFVPNNQYAGNAQFVPNSQYAGNAQFVPNSQYAGNAQFVPNNQYMGNGQYIFNNAHQNYVGKKQGLSEWLKWIFVIPLIGAILAVLNGMIGWAIALTVCGVVLFPSILEKVSKGAMIGLIVITAIIVLFAADTYIYQENVIDYVKEYKSKNALYPIGKYFEILECNTNWKYKEKEDREYVSVSFDFEGDSYELEFKIGKENIDTYPLMLSEVMINGKIDNNAYKEFTSRLFGR